MRKIAVLSTDNNPGYHFYVPIVEWVWNKFGWEIALFVTPDVGDVGVRVGTTNTYIIPKVDGVRTNTHAQTVRHFVANVLPKDAYIMVQDIDLIPLQNYWKPNLDAMTIWGWELTGYSYIPVHYTGMTGDKWFELMGCTGDLKADLEREIKANGRAYSDDWETYWNTDWDILTKKVLAQKEKFTFVERGLVNGLPLGRVDRSTIMVNPETNEYSWITDYPTLIDAHCENHNSSSPEKWANIRKLLVQCFGELPEWMDEHAKQHYEKYGQ